MSDVLIREIDGQALKRLKDRARRNGRSLQSEARLILEQAAGQSDVHTVLSQWNKRFAGRKLTSSTEMIREDRSR